MRVAIPKSHEPALAAAIGLSKTQREDFLKALRNVPPSIGVEEVSQAIRDALETEIDALDDIVGALSSLLLARCKFDVPAESFVDDICDAMTRTANQNLLPPDGDWQPFKSFLGSVFSLDGPFMVTSKAMDVLTSYGRTFCEARVISDIRPVFFDDPKEAPSAASVVHSLELMYHHNSRLERTYFALDSIDLQSMKRAIDRASAKDAVLRAIVEKSGMLFLERKDA